MEEGDNWKLRLEGCGSVSQGGCEEKKNCEEEKCLQGNDGNKRGFKLLERVTRGELTLCEEGKINEKQMLRDS